MLDSSGVDQRAYEISAYSVQSFYGTKKHFFDDALDAVEAGCVTDYSFDFEKKQFVGIVTSFDGAESFKVTVQY